MGFIKDGIYGIHDPKGLSYLTQLRVSLSKLNFHKFSSLSSSLRKHDVIGQIRTRTEKFKSTFYPHCLSEWNVLETETRLAPSVAIFKKKMLLKIRPHGKPIYGIHDPKGLSYLTQLRVGLSKLNFHKFKHNFKDTTKPMCLTNDGIEDTEHVLLLCPCFDLQRKNLLAGIYALLRPLGNVNLRNDAPLQLLLYGDDDFPNSLNRHILELTEGGIGISRVAGLANFGHRVSGFP